jgi:hypothetical protein
MAVAMAEDGSRTDWSTFWFEIRKLAKKSFAGIQSDQILGQMLAEAVMVLYASGQMDTVELSYFEFHHSLGEYPFN